MKLNSIKLVGGALVISGLLLTGCSEKKTADISAKVPEGSSVALVVRHNNPALAPVTEKMKELQKLAEGSAKSESDKKLIAILKETGLDQSQTRWAAVTMGQLSKKQMIPDVGIAISFKHDAAKIVASVETALKDEGLEKVLVPAKFAGLDGWEIDTKGNLPVKPCLASLEGEILVVGINQAMLEKMIALYRDGKGETKSFADITAQNDDVLGFKITQFGSTIKELVPDSKLSLANAVIENAEKIIPGLDNLEVHFTGKDTALALSINLKTASADDAAAICKPLKEGLASLKPMATAAIQNDAVLKKQTDNLIKSLDSIKIDADGTVAKISLSIPVELMTFALDEAKNNLPK